jgi:hypothetical protein
VNPELVTMLFLSLLASSLAVEGVSIMRIRESSPNNNAVVLSGQEQLSGQAFEQDMIVGYKKYQYVVYYNVNRHVCISRRKLPNGPWQEVILPYRETEDDAHRVISLGICHNDGTIHLAFDHHNDDLHYTRSLIGLASDPENAKWDASSFEATTSQLEAGVTVRDVTYPRFVTKPDGNLIFECRYKLSGNGDSYIREYDGTAHKWLLIGRYVQGMDTNPDTCAYINRFDYDTKGRIHVSWCWRDDPNAQSNHDLFYGYSDDHGRTWKDTKGTAVATTDRINPTDSRAAGKCMRQGIASLKVATISKNRGYINQESQSSDSKGRVHVLNSYIPDGGGTDTNWESSRKKARLHHRFRAPDGSWRVSQVKSAGTAVHSYCRAQVVCDALDNAFVIANGAEIYAATSAKDYTDWDLVSDTDKGRFCSEPQVDHPYLLSDGVLSFVYLGRDHKIIVIDYLADNPKTLTGAGLAAETIGGTTIWKGTFDTLYGEQYKLHLNLDKPAEVYVDGKLIIQKVTEGMEEISADVPLIASHTHDIVVKARSTADVEEYLLWSSERTQKGRIPRTSLGASNVVSNGRLPKAPIR